MATKMHVVLVYWLGTPDAFVFTRLDDAVAYVKACDALGYRTSLQDCLVDAYIVPEAQRV